MSPQWRGAWPERLVQSTHCTCFTPCRTRPALTCGGRVGQHGVDGVVLHPSAARRSECGDWETGDREGLGETERAWERLGEIGRGWEGGGSAVLQCGQLLVGDSSPVRVCVLCAIPRGIAHRFCKGVRGTRSILACVCHGYKTRSADVHALTERVRTCRWKERRSWTSCLGIASHPIILPSSCLHSRFRCSVWRCLQHTLSCLYGDSTLTSALVCASSQQELRSSGADRRKRVEGRQSAARRRD